MKILLKAIPVCIIILLIDCPLFGQLAVKSDFKRDEGKLQVVLTNKSPYMLLFLTQALSRPPHITIQSFDSEGEAIEWLRYRPSEHNGPYLFKEMYLYLKQNESYPLSFTIKPDITKGIPKYFIVTYYLPLRKLNIENISGTLFQQHKHLKGHELYQFSERFEFEPDNDENTAPLHNR